MRLRRIDTCAADVGPMRPDMALRAISWAHRAVVCELVQVWATESPEGIPLRGIFKTQRKGRLNFNFHVKCCEKPKNGQKALGIPVLILSSIQSAGEHILAHVGTI